MKQKDFLFVDIVSSIFLILLMFSNFFSLNYITGGSITISLIISVVLVICYFFLVDLLKKNKEVLFKKKLMDFSALFVVMFFCLSGVSFYLMQHLINVEFNCKDEIKKEAEIKLNQVDSLVNLYKRQSSEDKLNLEANLKTKLQLLKMKPSDQELQRDLAASPYFIDETILNNPTNINIDDVAGSAISPLNIKIGNNLKNLDSTVTLNSEKKRDVFRNWKRMSLIAEYNELNLYLSSVQNQVDVMLRELPFNKTTSNLIIDKSKLPIDNPSKLNEKFKPSFLVSIITILVIHGFILIPFFTTKIRGYSASNSTKEKNKQTINNSGSIEI